MWEAGGAHLQSQHLGSWGRRVTENLRSLWTTQWELVLEKGKEIRESESYWVIEYEYVSNFNTLSPGHTITGLHWSLILATPNLER